MTEDSLRKMLRAQCLKAGSVNAWARERGAPKSKVHEFLSGKRPPSAKILSGLRVSRVISYVKKPTP